MQCATVSVLERQKCGVKEREMGRGQQRKLLRSGRAYSINGAGNAPILRQSRCQAYLANGHPDVSSITESHSPAVPAKHQQLL